MFLKQLEVGSMKVFCYLLGCRQTGEALVIDPAGREHQIIKTAHDAGLVIKVIVNTHGHPDHTCGNAKMKDLMPVKTYIHDLDDRYFRSREAITTCRLLGYKSYSSADETLADGDKIFFGKKSLNVIHTPGHTPGSICLYVDNHLFTGDTLFPGMVGRTDFPGGSAEQLLESFKEKILTLPGNTIVWPGHYYGGRTSSTLSVEKVINPYLKSII